MKYNYEESREVYVFFTPRKDGSCREKLHINRCVSLKTGKTIVIGYLTKDNKVHRHKYPSFQILFITSKDEVMYDMRMSKSIKI